MVYKKKERKKVSSLDDLVDNFFSGNQSIEAFDFIGLDFDAYKFSASRMQNCNFIDCNFDHCIFNQMDFQRLYFNSCELKNCIFTGRHRHLGGGFKRCKLLDCDLSDSFLQRLEWPETSLEKTSFAKSYMRTIDFRGTSMKDVTFNDANIHRGNFKNIPNLSRNMFFSVKLLDCDFDWNEAFIVMEFKRPDVENLYNHAIRPVLENLDIEPKRVDRYEFEGQITEEIVRNLHTCRFVVAECSRKNPNVFFEIGYALGISKQVIFCVDKEENIPFDLKDYKFIIHEGSIDDLRDGLKKRVEYLLKA